jgi:replicative DNA helicase
MSQVEWANLGEAIAQVSQWEYFMDDSPRMTLKQLQTIARLWVSKGCDCILRGLSAKAPRAPAKRNTTE